MGSVRTARKPAIGNGSEALLLPNLLCHSVGGRQTPPPVGRFTSRRSSHLADRVVHALDNVAQQRVT